MLVAKVPGKSNSADLGTKHLDQNAMWTCLTRIGFAALQGQSNISLKAAHKLILRLQMPAVDVMVKRFMKLKKQRGHARRL